MKIFITGGQGFIAKNLIEFYHEHDLFEYQRDSIVQNDLKKFNPDVILLFEEKNQIQIGKMM